jgi:hypothetical protein
VIDLMVARDGVEPRRQPFFRAGVFQGQVYDSAGTYAHCCTTNGALGFNSCEGDFAPTEGLELRIPSDYGPSRRNVNPTLPHAGFWPISSWPTSM